MNATNKDSQWIADAAREIDGLYYEWFLNKLMKKDFPEPDERVPKIEAIIDSVKCEGLKK